MNNFGKKQLSGALFLFLVFGGGFLLLRDSLGTAQFEKTAVTGRTSGLFANEAEKDSDGDGLLDWEEGLWRTDPKNADSDGDGMPDGEEVRNSRNPLVAGPEDTITSLAESPLAEVFADSAGEKDLTLTDIFARDFVTGYFAMKQVGQFSEANRDKFIQTLFAGVDATPAGKYALADLTTTQKSDKETLKTYGNALGEVALRYRHLAEGKELVIVDNAVKQEKPEKLTALGPILADYKSFIEEYLSVQVPLSAYEVHLGLLNTNAAAMDAIAEMGELFNDPMRGAAGLTAYRNVAESGGGVMRDLTNFFSKNGVIFGNNEPGSIFNK